MASTTLRSLARPASARDAQGSAGKINKPGFLLLSGPAARGQVIASWDFRGFLAVHVGAKPSSNVNSALCV